MFNNWQTFISWEQSTMDTIDVKKIYIDIAEDLTAGILLSQIVYWYLPSKEGKSKLRIKKDGHFWIAKKRSDWYEEIRFSEQNYKTAIKKLEKSDLVIKSKKPYKFDGAPTTHIRLNIPIFLAKLNDLLKSTQSNLNSEEFDDFNSYIIQEIESKPLSRMDSVKLTESKRLNQPNGNGEINRMETVKSTDSLTEITSENFSERNTKSIFQSICDEIDKIDVHLKVKKLLDRKIDRLKPEYINPIEIKFNSYHEQIGVDKFVDILSEVLSKDIQKSFSSYLDKAINNYIKNQKEFMSSLDKKSQKPVRTEKLPDWHTNPKDDEKQEVDLFFPDTIKTLISFSSLGNESAIKKLEKISWSNESYENVKAAYEEFDKTNQPIPEEVEKSLHEWEEILEQVENEKDLLKKMR